MITFDIETVPLPIEELRQYIPPFDELKVSGAVFGEFDPAAVKFGNTKEQDKKDKKIEEARAAHALALSATDKLVETARASHEANFLDGAALRAEHSRVLVVGYYNPTKDRSSIDYDSEPKMLANFWTQYQKRRETAESMVGVYIHNFDLPYIVRRSWILGIDVPTSVMERHRYWCNTFVDLCVVWLLGQKFGSTPANFNHLGACFGTGGKCEGEHGKLFHELWHTNREQAEAYLLNDLKQPAEWARRMGIVK